MREVDERRYREMVAEYKQAVGEFNEAVTGPRRGREARLEEIAGRSLVTLGELLGLAVELRRVS